MPSFEAERNIIMHQIMARLREVLATVFTGRQSAGNVECVVTGPMKGPERAPKSGYRPFEVPGYWGGADETTWFRFKARVPASMKGREVLAFVRLGGSGSLAFVDGRPVTGLDPNRDFIPLTPNAKGGETFEITIEAAPHTEHPEKQRFEYADIAACNPAPWSFFWDATTALSVYQELPENNAPRMRLLDLLDRTVKMVDLNTADAAVYEASLRKAGAALKKGLKEFPSTHGTGRMNLVGHSHIDTAWLWPIRETRRKIGRTFSTVLTMMERYPEYRFSCSQPVQYEWMQTHYPELYKEVKKRVKEGRWEPLGCFWVEPDLNVPSGESLIRQTVYGNRFFRKEFGVHSRVAWTPDTFGYCWTLPQILKRAQVDYFATTKLNWNQFTEVPYNFFVWEGTDGSEVTALKYWEYNGQITPGNIRKQWDLHAQKDKTENFLFSYGFGDGGGGPTAEMLETGMRLADITGVPKCEFTTVETAIDRMVAECPPDQLPRWNGELYFELHRACQITQARNKRHNRKCELLLRDNELLGVAAMLTGGKYDADTLYDCWKTVLTNQFHDILPGSSVNEVYRDTDREYADVTARLTALRDAALGHLARQADTSGEGIPFLVANTLSWSRQGHVEVRVTLPKGPFGVVDETGAPVPFQKTADGALLVETNPLPPLGYAVYRVVPGGTPGAAPLLKVSARGLENESLKIRFAKDGTLASVYDKENGREVLAPGAKGNQLQLFEDRPFMHDAWDIDFNFEEHMWTPGAPESVTVVEEGPVRATVRMVWKTGRSAITQDVVLHARSSRVEFRTHVDWHERRTLLKAAFPVDIRSSRATYEIQFAAVERPTHHNRASDLAQFEGPAQRWADLSEGDYGVSLLNDCKYSYDIHNNLMRISLLRSPVLPDPTADEGEHLFTYALYPHAWDWRNGTVEEGHDLNTPLLAVAAAASKGSLPAAGSLAAIDSEHVVIDTVKKAEDSDAVIVRLYEDLGQRGDAEITFGQAPKKVTECDLMEENDTPVQVKGSTATLSVKPFEIRTLKVVF
jgi:alpha-mannosidase